MKLSTIGAVVACASTLVLLHPAKLLAAGSEAEHGAQCDHEQHAAVDPSKRVSVPEDGSPAQGPQTAPVTIVEFVDYQCPYCQRADGTVSQLRAKYGTNIRWVVKQMPMPMHERAPQAALAALAAQEQGKFFEMHAQLFGHPGELSDADLDGYAKKIGLDLGQFHAALKDEQTRTTLEKDRALAAKVGVRGVPSFVVNGQFVEGAQPREAFEGLIEKSLAKK